MENGKFRCLNQRFLWTLLGAVFTLILILFCDLVFLRILLNIFRY